MIFKLTIETFVGTHSVEWALKKTMSGEKQTQGNLKFKILPVFAKSNIEQCEDGTHKEGRIKQRKEKTNVTTKIQEPTLH